MIDFLKLNIYDKVVMVSGAGGSIGSELCRQIIQLQPKHIIFFHRFIPFLFSFIIISGKAGHEKIYSLSGGGPPTRICIRKGMNETTPPAIKHCPPHLLKEILFIRFYSLLLDNRQMTRNLIKF